MHREPVVVTDEGRVAHHGAVERDDGGQTLDVELVQGAAGAGQRLLPVGAVHDQLDSIESNCPPITEPASTPESSRTPGPVGMS